MIPVLADFSLGHPLEWAGVVAGAIAGGYGLLRFVFSSQERLVSRLVDKMIEQQGAHNGEMSKNMARLAETLENHLATMYQGQQQILTHAETTQDMMLTLLSRPGKPGKKKARR